jgi:hypothetical protein
MFSKQAGACFAQTTAAHAMKNEQRFPAMHARQKNKQSHQALGAP